MPFVNVGEIVPIAKLNAYDRVYDKAVTEIDVANTAAETSLYSKTISAGDMQTDRMLRLTLLGDLLRNNGEDPVLRVKFGATTLLQDTLAIGANSATRYPLLLEVWVAMLNSASSEWAMCRVIVPGAPGGATTGIGDLAGLSTTKGGLIGSSGAHSESTTVDKLLDITADWAAASAASSIRRKAAWLEMVPA